MSEMLDWQHAADPSVFRHVCRALRQGRVVAFPTETAYVLAASARVPEAVERLCAARKAAEEPPAVAVASAGAARDWLPGLRPRGVRLARRFWPGPLTLASADGLAEGLAGRLPEAVRARLAGDGLLRLRAPAHEAVREALRETGGPLVLGAVPAPDGAPGPEAVDARQALEVLGGQVDLVLDDGPSPYGRPATVVRVADDTWEVVRPGVVGEEQLRQQAACLILFVCTGNTCRSPLAEVLFKKRLAADLGCAAEELPGRGFHVLSAGLAAAAGAPAAEEAVAAAARYGADLSGHRSRALSAELAAQADYLVGMTHGHLRALVEHYPQRGARPRLLSPGGDDLADPIGCGPEVYEGCACRIWRDLGALAAEVARAG
jgi:protein-tyrosine phosphatase